MKKIIRLTESDLTKIVRRVMMEQTKVEGPFKDKLEGVGDLYIMKLDKGMCRWDKAATSSAYSSGGYYNGQTIEMTGSTCPEGFTTIPMGKFYVYYLNPSNGKIVMFNNNDKNYVSATNNGQGYNSQEEAKKGVSLILNPSGKVGRSVQKNDDGKIVSKYNQQGDLKKVKIKYDQNKSKYKTGL